MALVEVTDNVFINHHEVAAIEYKEVWEYSRHPLDGDRLISTGSTVYLKNGQKLYVPGLRPEEVKEKLGLI